MLRLFLIPIGLVEILNSVQTPHSCHFDVPDLMVCVQGFLKTQRSLPCICNLKLETQLPTKRGTMNQTKFCGPPSLRVFSAFSEHAYFDCTSDLLNRLELPRLRTYKAVRRGRGIVCLGSKPWETHWYASANCPAVFPSRL